MLIGEDRPVLLVAEERHPVGNAEGALDRAGLPIAAVDAASDPATQATISASITGWARATIEGRATIQARARLVGRREYWIWRDT
jgi:hypothetical protein